MRNRVIKKNINNTIRFDEFYNYKTYLNNWNCMDVLSPINSSSNNSLTKNQLVDLCANIEKIYKNNRIFRMGVRK